MPFQINKEKFLSLMKNREFKNIFLSFTFRLGSILCNFLIVPLLINQLSTAEYGILITIISISTWFTFVDFGVANGLKNKISESLARGEVVNVRKYIAAGYYALFKVVVVLSICLVLLNGFINWNELLKGPSDLNKSINAVFFYGLLLFFFRLLAELINPILAAYHKTAAASLVSFIAQFAILALCFVYKMNGVKSFLQYGLLFFWLPFLVFTACNIYFYSTSLKKVKPSKEVYEKRFQVDLFQLGGSFFIIQIAYLIVFTTDNLIVGRIFGYSEVSSYNIAFRYFNIPLFIISIVLNPYWPIFSECYIKKETLRIKKIMSRLISLWALIAFIALIMLFLAPYVYSFWIGKKIKIQFLLNLGMFLYCIISGWNSIFAVFINSTSKLRIQLISAIITGLVNVPLAIFLAKKTSLGPSSVIFSTCLCLTAGAVWGPIQYNKLVKDKARGVWGK